MLHALLYLWVGHELKVYALRVCERMLCAIVIRVPAAMMGEIFRTGQWVIWNKFCLSIRRCPYPVP